MIGINNCKDITSVKKRRFLDCLFNTVHRRNNTCSTILNNKRDFRDLWELWLNYDKKMLAKGVKFEDIDSDKEISTYANKRIKNLINEFSRSRIYKKELKIIRDAKASGGSGTFDTINQILITDTKEDIITKDGVEISRTMNTVITAKKIDKIEFNSDITIKTMNNIMSSQELSDEWFSNYKRAIEEVNGGKKYEGKYKFHHLELAATFKKTALDLASRLNEIILTGDYEDIRDLEFRMKTCEKLGNMMDKVKDIEFQPLKAMLLMHEIGINRQTESQRVIGNDRMLLEMGNIVVNNEKEVFDRQELRNQLKDQGFSRITSVFKEHLVDVGAEEDIS